MTATYNGPTMCTARFLASCLTLCSLVCAACEPKDAPLLRVPAAPSAPQRPADPPPSQPRSGNGALATPRATPAVEEYEVWSPCNETKRVVSDHFKTPWGRTPRDVLDVALGTHRTPMTWKKESAFSYGVEGTRTTLTIEITRRGPATFVRRDGSMRSGHSDIAYDCSSSDLLIPVHIKAETQDGVIAVERDSELTVSSRRFIGTSVGASFATHRGTLRIRDIKEKGLVVDGPGDGFGINFGFSRKGTMVGAIRGNYEITNVGALYVWYACFPDTPPPELRGSEELDPGCNG